MVAATLTLPNMAKEKGRGRGRPKNPEKDAEESLNVAIPAWLKRLCDRSAHKEGRHLKTEIARRLKQAFGLPPDADEPPTDGGLK